MPCFALKIFVQNRPWPAERLFDVAFGSVRLALVAQLLMVRQLAGGFLGLAFCAIGLAFDLVTVPWCPSQQLVVNLRAAGTSRSNPEAAKDAKDAKKDRERAPGEPNRRQTRSRVARAR
jgi:hypothetical protein